MDGNELLQLFVTSGITQMAKSAVESFISYLKVSESELLSGNSEEVLSEYLKRSYEYNAIMNTIVFRGEQKTIFDLYIPLTLTRINEDEVEEIIVDENSLEKLEEKKKIMIVDSAGMGKSTVAKFLSVQSVINNKYIPIIVELRKLSQEKDIWKYIYDAFNMLDQSIECKEIKSLVKKGGFLIIFDGYDEIAEPLREDIISQIDEFIRKADKNLYVLTSRDEEDLYSFGSFCEYRIKPLSLNESFALINKYGNNGERAKRLITVIKHESKNFSVIKEFLVNPLLVSLLYKTFEYKEELPYKKIEFYKQVYEALYNDHDKSKDAYVHLKKCGLAIREFESVLRYLAFFSMQKWCVEYDSIQELLVDVKEAIESVSGIEKVKAEDFVHDILHAVPLFQKDGSAYRWAHKSFMEYFAAQCIYLEMPIDIKDKLLTAMSETEKNARYYNVLDFYYDSDCKNIRKFILKPFLEKYIAVHHTVLDEFKKSGLKVTSELLDIAVSTRFFLEYKIIYVGDIEIDSERKGMKIFNAISDKYGRGSMTLYHSCNVLWHTNVKQNTLLPKLLNEKNVDLLRKITYERIDDVDIDWLEELFAENEYIDNMMHLLLLGLQETQIKKLYGYFFHDRNRIYCLDIEKSKKELEKIDKDISNEIRKNKDRFSYLEYSS